MIINTTKSLFVGKNYNWLTFSLVKFNSYIHINKNEISQIQDFRFVPKYQPLKEDDLNEFNSFIKNSKNLFVVSGAGISTESGIPDYRSEEVGLYSRSNSKPIQHSEFMKSANRRQFYWARNYVSWPIFSSFKPNISHLLFSEWEKKGKIYHHVTQNVDSLFIKAGCLRLTELHGSSYKVKCMDCDFALTRDSMQILIKQQNPNWNVISNELSPDNDVKLTDEQVKDFKTPICPRCKNDRLKPEVVFFGDNIPRNKVAFVKSKLSECDGLLAVGTSLEVYSAYRIILNAKELNIPICIVNIGKTRADNLADLKINALCIQILSKTKF